MSGDAAKPESLSTLMPGERGRIVAIEISAANRGRILEMGFTVGATVEVVRFAPLGDPMDIKIRGAHISLRKAEAAGLLIQRI